MPLVEDADVDWTERLIRTIEEKPALYNKELKEHSDRNTITSLWTEVCETMVPHWHDLTTSEQNIKCKEVQQKWRNLRTCFLRELGKQKLEQSGPRSSKRRKYIYFNQLLFLLPCLENREVIGDFTTSGIEVIDGEESEMESDCMAPTTSFQSSYNPPTPKRKAPSHDEDSLLNMLREKINEEPDEDKAFLLSLVPSFKRMTHDQKLDAKMEFLSVIKRISHSKHQTKLL